jgi:hypothetical protein
MKKKKTKNHILIVKQPIYTVYLYTLVLFQFQENNNNNNNYVV